MCHCLCVTLTKNAQLTPILSIHCSTWTWNNTYASNNISIFFFLGFIFCMCSFFIICQNKKKDITIALDIFFVNCANYRSVNLGRKFYRLQSSQKTNLKMLIFALAYYGRNFSFVFWENWKQTKRPFEINWPLAWLTLSKEGKNGTYCVKY